METNQIINRRLYTEQILPYIDRGLIKVLTGQRRVGKSYILKYVAQRIGEEHPEANVININLEDFAFAHVTDAPALHHEITKRLKDNRKNYIFIDEVQEVSDFDRVIRSLILDEKNDVFVTGSNSSMLSSEIASRLAGRSVETRIHPLSYNEFLEFHHLTSSYDSMMAYLRFGGLPYLRNLPDRSSWSEYIEGVVSAIVFRDVVLRNSIRNGDFLERLLMFLADNIGRSFSAKRVSDYLKSQKTSLSVTSIQNYLTFISQAYIINRTRRWDIEGKRYFEIGEKFYFEDLGMRNAIVGFKPADIAGVLENAVYNHLIISGYKVKTGSLTSAREIDFVAEREGETKYVQVAVTVTDGATAQREFGNLEVINDNYEKIVVTLNDTIANTNRGIRTYNLLDFLTNFK